MVETTSYTDHTVAVFSTHEEATAAINHLQEAGFDNRNFSVMGQEFATEERPIGFVKTGDQVIYWGEWGVFWGAVCGLFSGAALLFFPGLGYVMFAGWFASALEGALIGGGLAALAGAFYSLGIPHDAVVKYQTALKTGGYLLIVHGTWDEVSKAKTELFGTGATDVQSYTTRLPLEKETLEKEPDHLDTGPL